MKTVLAIAVPGGLTVTALLWSAQRLSPDTLAMALGMLLGVLAGLPAAVLVLAALRSAPPAPCDTPAPPAPYSSNTPPIIVYQAPKSIDVLPTLPAPAQIETLAPQTERRFVVRWERAEGEVKP